MSRGVVLWPDEATAARIRRIWDALDAEGIPSSATHSHRLHQPHVSLIVGEHLDINTTAAAIGHLPKEPIPLLIESAGVFPGGVLFLHLVANDTLLTEHRRVHTLARPHVRDLWEHFAPGTWTPHITCAWNVTPEVLVRAMPILVDHLPIAGTLDRGGIEDGTTGEHWPLPRTGC